MLYLQANREDAFHFKYVLSMDRRQTHPKCKWGEEEDTTSDDNHPESTCLPSPGHLVDSPQSPKSASPDPLITDHPSRHSLSTKNPHSNHDSRRSASHHSDNHHESTQPPPANHSDDKHHLGPSPSPEHSNPNHQTVRLQSPEDPANDDDAMTRPPSPEHPTSKGKSKAKAVTWYTVTHSFPI